MAAVQAFKTHRIDLLNVTDGALNIVSHLLSNEIIPEPTKARILFSNLPKLEKSEALLEAIEARIFINPDVFHTVVALLDTKQTLQKLAQKLRVSFRKFYRINIGGYNKLGYNYNKLASIGDILAVIRALVLRMHFYHSKHTSYHQNYTSLYFILCRGKQRIVLNPPQGNHSTGYCKIRGLSQSLLSIDVSFSKIQMAPDSDHQKTVQPQIA